MQHFINQDQADWIEWADDKVIKTTQPPISKISHKKSRRKFRVTSSRKCKFRLIKWRKRKQVGRQNPVRSAGIELNGGEVPARGKKHTQSFKLLAGLIRLSVHFTKAETWPGKYIRQLIIFNIKYVSSLPWHAKLPTCYLTVTSTTAQRSGLCKDFFHARQAVCHACTNLATVQAL